MKVADEVWIATASLHKAHAERGSFSAGEIYAEVIRQKAHPILRPGVRTHIGHHCVANLRPDPAPYRMLFRTPDGYYRLYKSSDEKEAHPERTGKVTPKKNDVPPRYYELIDWYHDEYDGAQLEPRYEDDPVLKMRGVGKELWAAAGGGDAYIARERAAWEQEARAAEAARPSRRRKAS